MKWTKESIEKKLNEVIAEVLAVELTAITPEAKFVIDLGADSLDTVELIMAIEEEFDSDIPDEDAEKLGTVKQAQDYLEKMLIK